MKVSLVVPLRDEEGTVAELMESIAAQDRPPDEIVAVDAGSRDQTADILRSFSGRLPVVVVSRGPLFPGEARNEGVRAASHQWIAFTDGGVRLDRHWLSELLSPIQEAPQTDAVLGNYEPVCDSLFAQCAALAYVTARGPDGTRGPSVASMVISRAAFDRVGGFSALRAGEDLLFLDAVLKGPIAWAPRAVAHWRVADTFAGTLRRFSAYSYHNLVGGLGHRWHAGLARLYVGLAAVMVVASLLAGPVWSAATIPAFLLARAAHAAWGKRRSFSFSTLDPRRVLGAALVLTVTDVGSAIGAIRWLLAGRPRLPGSVPR